MVKRGTRDAQVSQFTIDCPSGATPLDPNELDGLIPDYITTKRELNALERENILEAVSWISGRQHSDVLNATFAFNLHKRMLSRVWKWAGTQRTSNKTIGVSKEHISKELAMLFGNVKYWIDNKTFTWDQIGARFHHRLVWIHIFVNGNGRHARIMTDALLNSNGQESFSWGMKKSQEALEVAGALRREYILALKRADQDDYGALLRFVRS